MSRSLRYQNPVIYQHLANQYVAGVMTARVQARTETLQQKTPELNRAIAQRADDFSEIHLRLPELAVNEKRLDDIWSAIDKKIPTVKDQDSSINFWERLATWKITSGMGAFASILLAFNIFFTTPEIITVNNGPSYLANMSAANDPQKEIQFVISTYAKNTNAPSQLHVQWSQAHLGKKHPPLHLWAEDKDTQKLSYIGVQPPKGETWGLTKPTWDAIANSSRLFMTADNQKPSKVNTLFSGLCLQLKQWKS
jgi:anti-sigma-K factor RskA